MDKTLSHGADDDTCMTRSKQSEIALVYVLLCGAVQVHKTIWVVPPHLHPLCALSFKLLPLSHAVGRTLRFLATGSLRSLQRFDLEWNL